MQRAPLANFVEAEAHLPFVQFIPAWHSLAATHEPPAGLRAGAQ
jgi:hypothetical protein